MRGYLLNAAARSWGKWGGVVASTVVFAGLHAANPHFDEHPLAIAGLLLAGLYLASAYLITRNLWLAIFLHTGWNLLEGPIFGLQVSGMSVPASIFRTQAVGPELWTGGAFGPEAGLLLCLLMVVHIAALWAMAPLLRPRAVVHHGDTETRSFFGRD
jgi:membrane protease YdiL (CAAX protease family)